MQFPIYLFDFDGTLVDSRESLHPVFKAGYAAVGRDVTPEESEAWMHLSLQESIPLSGVPEEKWPILIDAIIGALDLPESLAMIKLFPDTVAVLGELKSRGAILGVVSNNHSDHIKLVLEQLEFPIEFDVIVGSNGLARGKPFSDPIDKAVELLGYPSRDGIVYVGDSLQDPACAKAAGVHGILLDRDGVYGDYGGKAIKTLTELL